jgi:hypothetical protein
LIIELHWEVAPHLFASTVNGERLWQNLITIDLNGTKSKPFRRRSALLVVRARLAPSWERLAGSVTLRS